MPILLWDLVIFSKASVSWRGTVTHTYQVNRQSASQKSRNDASRFYELT